MRSVVLGVCAVLLFVSSALGANIERFIGRTMGAFMLETMITPYDYFETDGYRVFVADKRAPDPRFGCSIQLLAKPNGKGSGADGWTIEHVRYRGGCDRI